VNTSIDAANAAYWNELCGTTLAKALGITDATPSSLEKFDDWYFAFYPYLLKHIRPEIRAGQRVLEVGLGYGSVGQKLALANVIYTGLDIAEGPARMMQQRLAQHGLGGEARVGNVLQSPFPNESFDAVVAIGCLHHTGNLHRALEELRRVLKTGGEAIVMVYSAYSYRRWVRWPLATLRYLLWDKLKIGRRPAAGESERAGYDESSDKRAAPATDFVSASELKRLAAQWTGVAVKRENIGTELLLGRLNRNFLLRILGPICGLDLYCTLRK